MARVSWSSASCWPQWSVLISKTLVITTSPLFIITLGVSHHDTSSDTMCPSTCVRRTPRWEWILGHPVSFHHRVSENRKLLGRGELPSCWPRPPASSQPLWGSCSQHYLCRLLLLIHCGQSIHLNATSARPAFITQLFIFSGTLTRVRLDNAVRAPRMCCVIWEHWGN